jgi:DNA-binding transcriptional regulator YdaS (Cro superfamily)
LVLPNKSLLSILKNSYYAYVVWCREVFMVELDSPTRRAIRLAGGQKFVADRLGVTPAAVSNWARRDEIPLERLPDVVCLVRGEMRPHEIRPDFFERLRAAVHN